MHSCVTPKKKLQDTVWELLSSYLRMNLVAYYKVLFYNYEFSAA